MSRACVHLVRNIEPDYRSTYYCKILHTEVQRRELWRMCPKCMYFEQRKEADNDYS